MFKILDIFRKSKGGSRFSAEKGFLLHKYDHFKNVLTGNNRALEIITDLEHLFYEDRPFTLGYLREQTRQSGGRGLRNHRGSERLGRREVPRPV